MQNAFTIEVVVSYRHSEWRREADTAAQVAQAQPETWWQRVRPVIRLVLARFYRPLVINERQGERTSRHPSSASPAPI